MTPAKEYLPLEETVLEEEALLAKIALKRGLLTREELKECLRIRRRRDSSRPLVSVLADRGHASEEEVAALLAEQKRQLKKRADQSRVKKKLRESQAPPAESRRPKSRIRTAEEPIAIAKCPHCGKPVQESARRCMHCGGRVAAGPDRSQVDEARAKSEYLCNLCFYPVFEDEPTCPACGAVFLKPGEGGEFKCSQCGHFVSEADDVCPWCQAVFASE